MVTDPETLAASERFQAPSHLDRVATDDDHRLESAIQRENAAMQTALSRQDVSGARIHARNVRELVAMRRPEVVEAMEKEKGLR